MTTPVKEVTHPQERFSGRVTYKTRSYAGRSECDIHLYDVGAMTVLVAIELADNPGASITNTAEDLAEHICRFFGIDSTRLVMVEHYNQGSYATGSPYQRVGTIDQGQPTWDAVKFGSIAGLEFRNPTWRRLQPEEMALLEIPGYTGVRSG